MKPQLALLLLISFALAGCNDSDPPAADPTDNGVAASPDTGHPTGAANLSADAETIQFTVEPILPTELDSIRLVGSVNGTARLSVEARRNGEPWFQDAIDAAGPWSMDLGGLPYGRSNVTITADDGLATTAHHMVAVRLAPFTFEVQYGGYPGKTNAELAVPMDIDAFLSAPQYEGRSAPHPTFANVHDLTVAWGQVSGIPYEVEWDDGLQGYGISTIDGAGSPLGSAAPPYWSLRVNGDLADFGMTLMPVVPGDHVAWCLNACV